MYHYSISYLFIISRLEMISKEFLMTRFSRILLQNIVTEIAGVSINF